jgi:hypothetical protein
MPPMPIAAPVPEPQATPAPVAAPVYDSADEEPY